MQPGIDGKTKVEKGRPSETNLHDLLMIRGPFGGKNRSKKQTKTVSKFDRKKGSEKRGKRWTKGAMTPIEPRPGSHLFGNRALWGVGGYTTTKTTKEQYARDLTRPGPKARRIRMRAAPGTTRSHSKPLEATREEFGRPRTVP